MTLFYLSTTDIHELRSPSTLGPAYGVAFETHEAAAMALAVIDAVATRGGDIGFRIVGRGSRAVAVKA